MASKRKLPTLEAEIVACRACPRLVAWRERVGRERRAAYADQTYWARPVPGFGDPAARLLVLGLAPGAHGANRTGRVFTGDRSGEWLYRAMWRAGLASQAESVAPGDGLALRGAWVSVAVRCAPPENRPAPAERDRCLPYLARELELLDRVRTVVALGAFAHEALCRVVAAPRPWPRFAHGAEGAVGRYRVIDSYHPSQQNTFTGRLTEAMLDEIFTRAADMARP
jgi:uracil-DNA glycosylase family 4